MTFEESKISCRSPILVSSLRKELKKSLGNLKNILETQS